MRADEPSLTARGVALARARLERSASPTGDPEGDVALATSLAQGVERPVDLAERERRALRRFLSFMEARTLFFDDAVVGAIDRGVNQVVILGAGYDGRALRFRTPGVRFFEVDHPATQADKRRRLEALDIATTGITFVEADFTEPGLDQRLADAGHRAEEQTQFLLEGVLRYLPEPACTTCSARRVGGRRPAANSRSASSPARSSRTTTPRRPGEPRSSVSPTPVKRCSPSLRVMSHSAG